MSAVIPKNNIEKVYGQVSGEDVLITAVMLAISDGATLDWPMIIGIWIARPKPIPATSWYMTHLAGSVPISSVDRSPAEIVAMAPPSGMRGAARPVDETILPERMEEIETAIIRGRFRTPVEVIPCYLINYHTAECRIEGRM